MANIEGQDWHKEIKTWRGKERQPGAPSVSHEKRAEFYKKRVKLKLQAEFDDVLKNLGKNGYKTLEDHYSKNEYIDVKKGDTLFPILKDYYKKHFKLDDAKAEQESYLTLAHVMKVSAPGEGKEAPVGNVDELEPGGKVTIDDGHLTIKDAKGNTTMFAAVRPKTAVDLGSVPAPEPGLVAKEEEPIYYQEAKPSTSIESTIKTAYVEEPKAKDAVEVPPGSDLEEDTTNYVEIDEPEEEKIPYYIASKEELANRDEEFDIPVLPERIEEPKKPEKVETNEQKQVKGLMQEFKGIYEVSEDGHTIEITDRYDRSIMLKFQGDKWILDENPELAYDSPVEAAKDARGLQAIENLWHNKHLSGEEPFYVYDYSPRYTVDWKRDGYVRRSKEQNVPSFVDHLNAKYKASRIPKQIESEEAEEFGPGKKAREALQKSIQEIPSDFQYKIISSTEILLVREKADDIHLKKEAGYWQLRAGDSAISYRDLNEAILDTNYLQKAMSETEGLRSNRDNPFYTFSGKINFFASQNVRHFVRFPSASNNATKLVEILNKRYVERKA